MSAASTLAERPSSLSPAASSAHNRRLAASGLRPYVPTAWRHLMPDEASVFAEQIATHPRYQDVDLARVQIDLRQVPFIPWGAFLRLSTRSSATSLTRYAILAGCEVVPITWNFETVRRLHEASALDINRLTVEDYLDFWLWFTHRPPGRRQLIATQIVAAEDSLLRIKGLVRADGEELTALPVFTISPGGEVREARS